MRSLSPWTSSSQVAHLSALETRSRGTGSCLWVLLHHLGWWNEGRSARHWLGHRLGHQTGVDCLVAKPRFLAPRWGASILLLFTPADRSQFTILVLSSSLSANEYRPLYSFTAAQPFSAESANWIIFCLSNNAVAPSSSSTLALSITALSRSEASSFPSWREVVAMLSCTCWLK